MKPTDFASRRPCDSQARSRSTKVVDVNDAYKQGRYKKNVFEQFACIVQR